MTDKDHHSPLMEEAAMLFLAVSEDSDDAEVIAERDRFLARGDAERAAFAKVENGWRVSGGRSRSRLPLLIPFLMTVGIGLYLIAEPLRIYMIADLSTGRDAQQTTLQSGDLAHLDAGSAIKEDCDQDQRDITLLQGGAFFDVATDGRPFVVAVGTALITVRGTSFETALLPDGGAVSVSEGVVDVVISDQTWQLTAGEQLLWG